MRVNRRSDETAILNPGILRHRLQFFRIQADSQNTFGEDSTTRVLIAEAYGQVRSLQGRELEQAQQRWAEARYRVICHYFEGLSPKDEIEVDGPDVILNILDSSDDSGTGRILTIIARDYITGPTTTKT